MVFHFRCFSFQLEEETIFHTAFSEFNKAAIVSNFVHKQSNLRVFTLAELKAATNNFCKDSKIGDDRFGSVYKGVLKGSEPPFDEFQVTIKFGALKRLKKLVMELNVLGVVEHPNIVKLVGYCLELGERGTYGLLVYEYMANRSVHDHLTTKSGTHLSWAIRLKVARDVARALSYLHQEMEFQHIFEDFTSSNIFLDEHWNAKLSDFRFTPLGPGGGLAHVSSMNDETVGYTAPEHIPIQTLMPKSNTWSYGVFLYELITGRPPLDRTRPENQQELVEWVKPFLRSTGFQQILDPKLQGKYSLKSAKKLSYIANMCLSQHPNPRPNMREVLEMVNELIGFSSQATDTAHKFKSMVRRVAIKLKKVFMSSRVWSEVLLPS